MIQRKQTKPNILLTSFIDLEYKHTNIQRTNKHTNKNKEMYFGSPVCNNGG